MSPTALQLCEHTRSGWTYRALLTVGQNCLVRRGARLRRGKPDGEDGRTRFVLVTEVGRASFRACPRTDQPDELYYPEDIINAFGGAP